MNFSNLDEKKLKNKKILVTGAAGFIGNNLAYKLMTEGFSIICLDNFNDYYDPRLKLSRRNRLDKLAELKALTSENYTFMEVDLRDKVQIELLFQEHKPEIVCHLAAQAGVRYSLENPKSYVDNNVNATVNLLECSKDFGVMDFLFASTSSVYGLSKNVPFKENESIDSTISTYSATKRACELICHTYHKIYGLRFRILRFFTVYGPWGRPDMALFIFTKSILEKKPISIFNHGEMNRDFTYIDDIVNGFYLAIKKPYDFEIINLGAGKTVSLMDFITILEKKLGLKSNKKMEPLQLGDVPSTWADISKARQLLNYNPQTNLEEGVSNFVDWYRAHYYS